MKIKADLKEAAYYGEWCSEEDSEHEVHAWFEKSSFKFFYTSNLIDKFGYKDCKEIEESGYFIPVFKVDIIALQKEFIANYPDKEIEETMNWIIANDNFKYNSGYAVAFRILTQDYPEFDEFGDKYFDYEQCVLRESAQKWCDENNVPYYTPNDPDRILDLRDTLPWAYGTSTIADNGEWIPRPVWFCRTNCKIMDYSEVEVVYGYKNYDDVIESGNFVRLFKVEQEDIEKEYFSKYYTEEIKPEVQEFIDENKNYGYEYEDVFTAFGDFTTSKYYEHKKLHEETHIFERAKKWCAENNIPYYISKDGPDHWGSKLKKTGNGS